MSTHRANNNDDDDDDYLISGKISPKLYIKKDFDIFF
jgi:hypothetical protein